MSIESADVSAEGDDDMRTEKRSPAQLLPAVLMAAALVSVAAPTAIVRAQEPPPPVEPRPGEPPFNEELAETIQDLMLRRLETQLELSDEQKETVIPLVRDLTELRRTHNQRRREGLRTIGVMAQDSGVDEESLSRRLDSFYREQAEFRGQEMELAEKIRSHLDPRQQARLLQFEERFRNEMRRRFEDARRRGGSRSRGERPRPGAPPRP
jgi:Spy/CpxP family protein refolding chaperone